MSKIVYTSLISSEIFTFSISYSNFPISISLMSRKLLSVFSKSLLLFKVGWMNFSVIGDYVWSIADSSNPIEQLRGERRWWDNF
jgi:hypothetical protein